MRKSNFVIVGALALLMSACTGESDRPVATGEGVVRAINAISTSPDFFFAIEERFIDNVSYSTVSSQNIFDDLDYTFNFEVNLPGQVLNERVASVLLDVERDREYTFVISGDVAAPTIIVWDAEVRVFDETATAFQSRFAHTAESLGPIDVYFAAPGVAPAAGQEVATLAFGELSSPVDNAPGDFVYIVTTAGDPGDILFESEALTTSAQSSFIITPFDATANNSGSLSVRIITDGGNLSSLPDVNATSTVRFIHASQALATSDIYTDEMLMEQILANHAYRDVTGDLDLAPGNYTLTYTAAGNAGSILLESDIGLFSGAHAQVYAVGEVDALTTLFVIPNRRPVETVTRFTFTHASYNHSSVDLYLVEAGTPLDDVILPVFFGVPPGTLPLTTDIDQGDLEMYLTVSGEKTVIAGPVALTTALGDVIEYIAYDNVDPATADLVEIPAP